MDGDSYAYGEVPVTASVGSAQRASLEDLVALAKRIWRSVRDSGVAAADDAGNDALLKRLQGEHPDFTQSFPIVLRWMVQMRQFSGRALEMYLRKHATTTFDSRESFLRLQAEYVVMVFREKNRGVDQGAVDRYRDAVCKSLLDEDKEFQEIQKQVEADLEARGRELDQERRQRLYKQLLSQKVAREAARAP